MIVVKVQRPLFSTDPNVGYLVYDEHRVHMVEQVPTEALIKAMGEDLKSYHEAKWRKGAWQIGKRVRDRSW